MCLTLENEQGYKLWQLPWKTGTRLGEKLVDPRYSVESDLPYGQGKSYQEKQKSRVRAGQIFQIGRMLLRK